MSRLILPAVIWNRQPQFPTRLDRSNTICRGLTEAFIPAWNKFALGIVTNGIYAGTSPNGVVATVNGLAVPFVSASSQYLERNLSVNGATGLPLTIAARVRSSQTTGVQTIASLGQSNGASKYARLLLYQSKAQLQVGSDSGSPLVAAAVNYSTTDFFSVAGTFDSASEVIYYNGGNKGSATTAIAFTTLAYTGISTNYNATAREPFNGDIEYVYFWNRILSEAEILSIHRNPYQIFQPLQKNIWVPSAGGATTHATTGSLIGQGATVSGSSAHIAIHGTTGTLVGQGATVAGTAARTRQHATDGILVGQGATVAGTAIYNAKHTTTGTLTGQGATLSGAATLNKVHAISGILVGDGATVIGIAVNGTAVVTENSGGWEYTPIGRQLTKKEIRKRFKLDEKESELVIEVAQSQAENIDLGEAQRKTLAKQKLKLAGIEAELRHLQAISEYRESLINAEIAQLLKIRQIEAENEEFLRIAVLLAMAA